MDKAAGKPWRQVAGPLRAKPPKLAALLIAGDVLANPDSGDSRTNV